MVWQLNMLDMGMDICHITWSVLLWYSGYGYAGKIQAVGNEEKR